MVYLIHFSQKLHHAQHYIGFVKKDLNQRLEQHQCGQGAKLLAAVTQNGITWEVVKVWNSGSRQFERKLKNFKKARRFCPVCNEYHYL